MFPRFFIKSRSGKSKCTIITTIYVVYWMGYIINPYDIIEETNNQCALKRPKI